MLHKLPFFFCLFSILLGFHEALTLGSTKYSLDITIERTYNTYNYIPIYSSQWISDEYKTTFDLILILIVYTSNRILFTFTFLNCNIYYRYTKFHYYINY